MTKVEALFPRDGVTRHREHPFDDPRAGRPVAEHHDLAAPDQGYRDAPDQEPIPCPQCRFHAPAGDRDDNIGAAQITEENQRRDDRHANSNADP
jgi:hypothetical protein